MSKKSIDMMLTVVMNNCDDILDEIETVIDIEMKEGKSFMELEGLLDNIRSDVINSIHWLLEKKMNKKGFSITFSDKIISWVSYDSEYSNIVKICR